ncbi:sugar ABC transporter substrate-binding protein [Neorhizobium sp. P12A]|jgi:putative xylitol transport system substrate-binding protein|uniref:substrate-binding domain-containing protein n=1 Tax=Rhizobium/Agrobacterium group TaxID=227290 RepID=UPI0010457D9A|nr:MULTISPECIES: substrate-binding domain-containing protein [Rhizobium/Agrobacterium group]KAA0691943.1 sugar ABC transporter substrate-binding protein [Neorhizobium sp. P12A]TCR74791.1 monosaccharide ABC transporter substrate-binding protein (CUT2 family) [Rhizobium sp. BK376]
MKLLKLGIVSALALSALTSFASAADPIKVGVSLYGLKAEFMQLWAAAVQESPAVKSGKVQVTVFDGRYDPLVQQDQFSTMISQKYNAIIFAPIDADAGATAVKMAHDAKIPVVGTNTKANTDLLSSYVGSDDTLSGYMEAKTVLDKIGCKGNVVVIQGPIGISAQIQRSQGNDKALAECPNVKVLETKTANWSRAEAQALMENWLTRYPGQINGVIGQNDEMALGAIEAIKGQGLNVSDFAIAGIDGITDALLAVKAGEMTSILQDARAQAMGSLDVAAKLADPSYQPQSDVWKQYPDMPFADGKSANYNVPWTPVTAQNVDALLKFRNK